MKLIAAMKAAFKRGAREAYFDHPLTKQVQADAWAEGHESGFWNGRHSSGSSPEGPIGVEHAKAENPYLKAA